MSAVILRPHSNTNPSDKFRVVKFELWADTDTAAGPVPFLRECDTEADAKRACEQYNDFSPDSYVVHELHQPYLREQFSELSTDELNVLLRVFAHRIERSAVASIPADETALYEHLGKLQR